MTSIAATALVRASAEDHVARVERNALRAVLPFLRRRFRGELMLTVFPDGSVDVAIAPSISSRDSRWAILEVTDLEAERLLREAIELGIN